MDTNQSQIPIELQTGDNDTPSARPLTEREQYDALVRQQELEKMQRGEVDIYSPQLGEHEARDMLKRLSDKKLSSLAPSAKPDPAVQAVIDKQLGEKALRDAVSR